MALPRLGLVPELPEVQALAERIETALSGAALQRVEPLAFAALKTFDPPAGSLVGRRLEDVRRRGKFLLFGFGDLRLALHLSQAGRITFEAAGSKGRPKGGLLRLRFEREPVLLFKEFGTERKAGWWVLRRGDDGPLAKLGREPFSAGFEALLREGDDTGRLHAMLRDQRRVAGIGRGYADDILHRAKLSPFRALGSLDHTERQRLLEATRSVLAEGLEVERRRSDGLPPKLGDHWIVHKRSGTPCPTCGDQLRRVAYESHEVTYCPRCQTGGRILADRRLSRLLK